MTTITPEIRQAIEQAGDRHVELLDPVTRKTYFLVTSEWLQGLRDWFQPWYDDGEDYDEHGALLRTSGDVGRTRTEPTHRTDPEAP